MAHRYRYEYLKRKKEKALEREQKVQEELIEEVDGQVEVPKKKSKEDYVI